MTTTSPPELTQAIHLARGGQKEQAVTLLRQILKQTPNNVQALLWLSGLTPNLDEGIVALERALQLDPGNEAAQRGLADLRARRQGQVQGSDSAEPQGLPSPKPPLPEETTPPPTAKQSITGEELQNLAGSVIWPFKGLKRPLGELLAEGVVQPRNLGWAVWKAFDPTVKWAAAIHLKAKALQAVSLRPDEARQVVWPFKDLNRPMGELLAEQVITLHDLAWAVANAYDAAVSEAAAVLGAEIVQRTLPMAGSPAQEASPAVSEGPAVLSDTPQVGEKATPIVELQISPDERPATEGKLRVIVGSAYLREQEEQKSQQKAFWGWVGIILLLTAMVCATWAILLQLVGVIRLPVLLVVAGVAFVGLAWMLLPRVEQLKAERDNFAAGRRGEEKLVTLLQEHLDGRWTLFRNVLLPDGYGDIDAVLTGPRGIFALEVKAYSGYNRNVGKRWRRHVFGFWRTLDRNPTRQALQNARRLHDHLRQNGVEVWVEPRIVWAGEGKLWLEKPAVRVWQLTDPDYIREDIGKGKATPAKVLSEVNAVLAATQPERPSEAGHLSSTQP